eukprot:2665937-Karenia_brevis.AAC.1
MRAPEESSRSLSKQFLKLAEKANLPHVVQRLKMSGLSAVDDEEGKNFPGRIAERADEVSSQ